MCTFEEIANCHGVGRQLHGPRGPLGELAVDRHKAAANIDGLQVHKLVRLVEIANNLRHAGQQVARDIGQVHPAQLDESRVLGEVVNVHVVECPP